MTTELIGNDPKLEDGCVIKSWRCKNPSRDDMNEDPTYYNIKCKLCTTCGMVYCQHHMTHADHFAHCHARLAQEKVALKDMQDKNSEEKNQTDKDQKEKIEFQNMKREAKKNGHSDV